MKEDYLISVVGNQTINDQKDKLEITTLGTYTTKGDKRYIAYNEYDNDAKPVQKSILKVEKSKVTLMRGGAKGTKLILEDGQHCLCHYETEFGGMMLGIYTSQIENNLTDEGGSLKVCYTLDINSAPASRNELFITVKEAAKNNVKNSIKSN